MASLEILGVVVFSLQQIGMALGLGGAGVELALALRSIGGQAIEAANGITRIGFWLVVLSGIFITGAHFLAGESAVIYAPVYLFKWILLGLILLLNIIAIVTRTRREPHAPITGLLVGTWFALFVLHTLAPSAASWSVLVGAYCGWIVVFFSVYLLIEKFVLHHELYSFGGSGMVTITPKAVSPSQPVTPLVAIPLQDNQPQN